MNQYHKKPLTTLKDNAIIQRTLFRIGNIQLSIHLITNEIQKIQEEINTVTTEINERES